MAEHNWFAKNPAIKRAIKRKETELSRKCRELFCATNPQGRKYLYGRFCRAYDKLIVTLAYESGERWVICY